MSAPLPICHLNGSYVPLEEARVSALDRGFLFADSVYEVVPVYAARPFRLREHLLRLDRSLEGIRMAPVMPHESWGRLCSELIARNAAHEAYIYMQVSRGAEFGRNHAWPSNLEPTIFAYCTALEPLPVKLLAEGVAVITAHDIRWARRDIKSTALLGNILLKHLAVDAGAYETVMLEDGELTEGSSTTVQVVQDGVIYTPADGAHVLPGTTRDVVSELAAQLRVPTRSGPISEKQLRSADEIWLSFATRGIVPVTRLDGAAVGGGRPGALFKQLRAAFDGQVHSLAGTPPL